MTPIRAFVLAAAAMLAAGLPPPGHAAAPSSVLEQDVKTEPVVQEKVKVANVEVPPRHFVLAFRILEYNDALRRAMDYFFGQVLGDSDQLLALVNERTLVLNRDVGQGRRHEILEQALAEESLRAKRELEVYFQRVRRDIDQTHLKMLLDNSRTSFQIPQIISFLDRYLEVWREFKYRYLTPDLDKFYNFSRYLREITGEKWVLSFFQIGLFPRMRPGGPVHSQVEELVEELNGAPRPVECGRAHL